MHIFFHEFRSIPRLSTFLALSILMSSCAPRPPSESGEDDDGPTPSPRPLKPLVVATREPGADAEGPAVGRATPVPRATLDPENPDWELRYQQLHEHYLSKFKPPRPPEPVEVVMAGGRKREGVLLSLTDSELELDIGTGVVVLSDASLADESRERFFKQHFARLNALRQGRVEYRRWKRMRELAEIPDPTPMPDRELSVRPIRPLTMPVPGNDGVNTGRRVDADAEPPKNEGPTGRVWQVDKYLRQNSAVPHSLRYKQWGKVRKHENGYKVRVRYSVESAEDFGTSHEDMMFFMHADGKVYRRAPVK